MAGLITALKIQERNKERVNVFLDDHFAFAVTALVAVSLKKDQYLSDAEIEQLKGNDEADKAYDLIIRFLGFRPRSQVEIEQHLRRKKYSPTAIQQTLERLQGEGYLDDEAFAQFWLENRERFKPRGRQALRFELKQKGLSHEIIETTLDDLDETESAWTAVTAKIQRWRRLDEQTFKQKVMGFLSRRGFNYEIAAETANRAWVSLDSPED
jgi:regulatory protein